MTLANWPLAALGIVVGGLGLLALIAVVDFGPRRKR